MIFNVWRRSKFCTDSTCVEVAQISGEIHVRNSIYPTLAVRCTADEFRAFIAGVKSGEFDDLVADA